MSEFDQTKKAIGLGNLDDSSRKDMFEKFKSAGGEVVKEKKAKLEAEKKDRPQPKVRQGNVSRTEFDRSGGKSSGGRSGSGSSSGDSKSSQSSSKNSVDASAAYEKEISSFTARFAIKLKCWFARVTPFGIAEVTPACMGIFARDMKSALMEFQMVGNELLGNGSYSPKITQALDKVNPLIVEVLGMGHKLYNSVDVNELTEMYQLSPDRGVPIDRIKDPLIRIFKKLYVLYPYQESYRKGVSLAYEHLQKLEGKPALIYNSRRKKILSELDNLFGTIFEKMYLIVIRGENKNIPMVSKYMENLLGITPHDKPGQRHAGEGIPATESEESDSESTEDKPSEEKEAKEKEEVVIPKEMAYGLRLMKMYTIEQLRKKFDPRSENSPIPDSDKAFLAYLYFKEFDDNYSFVMTTKKIDLKQVHVAGNRVDYRQKLLDLYETARGTLDQFRIYQETFKEFTAHKANPGANYIEASKKTTALETKRSQHSRNVRVVTKEFMEKTRDLLLVLINDMKSKREIVGNMDDIMTFDSVEAKKRLNKKPVKQCIMEAYCFTLALAERLENGDLYGGVVELSPEEMKESFGVEVKDENDANSEKAQSVEQTLDAPPPSSPEETDKKSPDGIPETMDSDEFSVDY
ncbi:hypothetical protein [Leptospira sp. GIMC2001]|uniref:hypothetical protein n=1 Tax=Leptospira sp. GIMC2001 TaxID=1513297 RepID=UPI00234A0ADF|nr:hypothetical protein [Leptospira sp. GIMC2001]WCL47993.1 hypothetical protein O4O04_11760 [Leptospira sp. GIMC2001]